MKKQQGFTLIELMIVVAITGILAAIAFPTYQSFTAKAQTSEAIALLDAARTNSEDIIGINGEFPLNKAALIFINTQINGSFGVITGTANTVANQSSGDVIYQFKAAGVNENIKGKSVWYNRTDTGIWECRTNLAANFAPKLCESGHTAPSGS
jgi:prepilin-type N-terminal cleavage/methylation domain-containing protein